MRRRMVAGLASCVFALLAVVSASAFTLADGSTGWSTLVGKRYSSIKYNATATTNIDGGQVYWTIGATATLSGLGGNSASRTVKSGAVSVDSPSGTCHPRPCTLTFTSFHTWDGVWQGANKHYENSNTARVTVN